MLVPKELVAWWVKHHSLRLHVLFNRKNNNNNNLKKTTQKTKEVVEKIAIAEKTQKTREIEKKTIKINIKLIAIKVNIVIIKLFLSPPNPPNQH